MLFTLCTKSLRSQLKTPSFSILLRIEGKMTTSDQRRMRGEVAIEERRELAERALIVATEHALLA